MRVKGFLSWLASVAAAVVVILAIGSATPAGATYPYGIKNNVLWSTRAYYGDLFTGTGGNCTVTTGTVIQSTDLYCSTVTISSGATLFMQAARLYADTIVNNGVIGATGGAGSAGTGGSTTTLGILRAGTAGGSGSAGTTGGAGTAAAATAYDALSGTGGAGGSATNAGGIAGARTNVSTCGTGHGANLLTGIFMSAQCSQAALYLAGGTGGGAGGAASGTGVGGGGGAGGGVLLVATRSLQGNGVFTASGGSGGNGTAGTSAGTGGGGGGGGGFIGLTVGDQSQWTGSTNVSGGSPGTHTGTGSDGASGSSGTVIIQQG